MDNVEVLEAIRQIEGADDSAIVLEKYTEFIEAFGFSGVLIGHMVDPQKTGVGDDFGVSTWPTELMKIRRDRMAFIHDPVIKYALRTMRPFRWDEAYAHANRFGTEVIEDVRDFGLGEGIMLPMIALDAPPGGISLGAEKLTITDRDMPVIQLVSQHCYFKLQRLFGPYPFEVGAELTRKEIDALHFAASGKTAWETSIILGTSETAVKDALKRARQKLDASNGTQAVAKAMARRLII